MKEKEETILIVEIPSSAEAIKFGADVLDKYRKLIKKSSNEIEKGVIDTGLIDSLNRVLKGIDVDEIIAVNQSGSSKLQKLLDKVTNKKDKIIAKYFGISNELEKMYVSIKQMAFTLQQVNSSILKLREEMKEIREVSLPEKIAEGQSLIEKVRQVATDENLVTLEVLSILNKRVSDLNYAKKILQKEELSLHTLSSTNYDICIALISTYDTTMPDIQSVVNVFQVLKTQKNIITSIEYLKEKRNELALLGAQQVIENAKESMTLITTAEDFKVINSAIQTLINGKEEIKRLAIESNAAIQIALAIESQENDGGIR